MCADSGSGIHYQLSTVLSTKQFNPAVHYLRYGRRNAPRGTFAALKLMPLFTCAERLNTGWAEVVTSSGTSARTTAGTWTAGAAEGLEAAATGC